MKKTIYLKTVFVFVIFLCLFSSILLFTKNYYFENKEKQITQNTKNILENINKSESKDKNIFEDNCIGIIKIPSIDLVATIYQGTSNEILKYWVGHFENTPDWQGNVALASHNEGSYAHYFSRINELEIGEEIIYITNMGERRYQVYENKIIEETNVKVLENTKDNTITLITCITGKRNFRRCVVGKEKY